MESGLELNRHDLVELVTAELLELDPENELLKYWIIKEDTMEIKKYLIRS